MKKIKLFLLMFITLLMMPQVTNAASGKITVSGTSTVVVGNRATITVTLSSNTAIGSWQMDLNYDKNYLQLVSSTAEAGGTKMANSSSGTKSKTYTFVFKALKSGSPRLSVSSYLAYDYETMSDMDLTSSSKTIKIMTQAELEATYSKDNNLKNLSVEGYELDKEFNKNTLEYTVNVPTGTTSVKIKATENDSKSSVSGDGEVTVTEGLNTIPITVTAQNGSEKTYTLIVNVEDLNPIDVKIDNKDYIVVKNGTLLTAPPLFQETKITINNFEIPAFRNNAANITLVGLKDTTGKIDLFIYEDNEYKQYKEMNLKEYLLIPTDFEEELDLIKTTVTINNEEIKAYKESENSKYVIISAKNLEDGKVNLYLYDQANNTAILYDNTFINETNETIKNYTYIIIAFASALGVMLILIFCLLHSLRKKQKKIKKFVEKQEAKIEATMKLNDVITEVKNITENNIQINNQKAEKELEENNKEQSLENKKEDKKLSKKELKKLKKLEKKEKEKLKVEQINIEEMNKNKNEKIEVVEQNQKETEDQEEVYDLFGDDKKKRKKKK